MDADLLLAWMSETGSGDVQELRRKVTWLARTADLNPSGYDTGSWLRDMSALGHAEVDWDSSGWAITPAAGALLPACGGTAVLAGSRRLDLLGRLEAQDVAVQVEAPCDGVGGRLPAPTTVYVQADSIANLEAALAEVGVRYVGCAAQHIADALPSLRLGQPAAPPAWSTQTEHLILGAGIRFRGGLPDGDVLCRISVHGRPSYLYRSGHDWFHTDHAHGILWALAERRIGVFRWRRERIDGEHEIGTMFVDKGVPLPPLQARALTLCSGLPAQFDNSTQKMIYHNVPERIAEQVARSVRQHVSIIP